MIGGFVLIWIICGIACAAIGSGKGVSGAGWFFIGVLLGPIGVVLVLVMKAGPPAASDQPAPGSKPKRLPKKCLPPSQRSIVCPPAKPGYYE